MASETFDDFDSTDLAMQLTEMAANRRQLLEARVAGDSIGGPISSSQSDGNGIGGYLMSHSMHDHHQGAQEDDGAENNTPITMNSPPPQQRIQRLPVSSPPQDLSMAGPTSTNQLSLTPAALFTKAAALRHPTPQPQPQLNSFNLEDFLVPPTSTLSSTATSLNSGAMPIKIMNPSRTVSSAYTVPLSFLPSCSFNTSNNTGVAQPIIKSIESKLLPNMSAALSVSGVISGKTDLSGSTSTGGGSILPAGIDLSTLLAAYEFRRNSATAIGSTGVGTAASSVVPSSSVATTVAAAGPVGSSSEDKDAAEALMQRMIEEGRLTTKRQRTSGSRRESSIVGSGSSSDDMSNIIAAAAGSCGLNLSIGGTPGGVVGGKKGVRVKEEALDAQRGELVAVGGVAASRQFDNLYLAYTAAMQQAAAGGASNLGAGQQADVKPSQNILLGVGEGGGHGGSSIMFDATSVDAQAAQAARLAMLHLQMPQLLAHSSSGTTGVTGTASLPSTPMTLPSGVGGLLGATGGGGGRRYSSASKTFHCLACGKALSSMHNLKLHEATVHRGLFQYRCPLCGKGLRQERDLRGHLANRHNMKKDFRCSMCGNEFGYKRNLKQHMVSYHGWKDPIVQQL